MQMFPRPGTAGGTGSSGQARGVRARVCGGGGSRVCARTRRAWLLPPPGSPRCPTHGAGSVLGAAELFPCSGRQGRGWDRAPGAERDLVIVCPSARGWGRMELEPAAGAAGAGSSTSRLPRWGRGGALQLAPLGLQMCGGEKKKRSWKKGSLLCSRHRPAAAKRLFFLQKGWAAPSCTHTQPQAAGIFVPCPWLRAPEAEQGREHPARAPGGSCGGQLQPPACPGGEGKPKPELREGCGAAPEPPPFPWEPQVCVFPPGCQLGPAPQPCSTCPVL